MKKIAILITAIICLVGSKSFAQTGFTNTADFNTDDKSGRLSAITPHQQPKSNVTKPQLPQNISNPTEKLYAKVDLSFEKTKEPQLNTTGDENTFIIQGNLVKTSGTVSKKCLVDNMNIPIFDVNMITVFTKKSDELKTYKKIPCPNTGDIYLRVYSYSFLKNEGETLQACNQDADRIVCNDVLTIFEHHDYHPIN